jgi:hypothetical protein
MAGFGALLLVSVKPGRFQDEKKNIWIGNTGSPAGVWIGYVRL